MVKLLIFFAVLGIAAWFGFQQTLHSNLRDLIHAEISEKLQHVGAVATLGDARFLEGQGIKLHDLTLVLPSTQDQTEKSSASQIAAATRIEFYEAFIHVPVSAAQLMTSELQPRAIQIRRAKIQLTQNQAGDWNLPNLLNSLQALKTDPCEPIPVSLTDCSIEFLDPTTEAISISDISLDFIPIEHQGRSLIQLNGRFNGRDIGGTQFTAYFDPAEKTWFAEFGTQQIRLNRDLLSLLPETLKQSMGQFPNVSGELSFSGSASGSTIGSTGLGELPNFELHGTLARFACDDDRLPMPIREAQLDFEIDNRQIKLSNIKGRMGEGTFDINYHQIGLLTREQWSTAGKVDRFDFTHHRKWATWFPAYFGHFCNEYSPIGFANIQFNLRHDGKSLRRNIHGQLTDMSCSYRGFPYRVDHCIGDVSLIDEHCKFQVKATEGQQVSQLKGVVKNPGPDATFEVHISVPGDFPIDEKMRTAIQAQPKLATAIKPFAPTGRVSGIGRIERLVPRGKTLKSFDIRLKQCNVRHRHFDYPISNVNGLVQTRNGQYLFTDITGSNGSGEIECNGKWDEISGLDLRFICKSVPLDDQLKYALKPELRDIWHGFRPSGTADLMRVDLKLPVGQTDCDVTVEANLVKPTPGTDANVVSIFPTWFPYQIKQLTGTIRIGDGKIKLTDMEGLHHQRTWFVCQGDGHYSDESWSVKFNNLLVGSLQIDDDLISALPKSLAPPIRQLHYEGLVNVKGEMTLAGQYLDPAELQQLSVGASPQATRAARRQAEETSTSLAWDLRFDMNQAKMKVGLPLENVFGSVRLEGQYDGQTAECRGELDLDSLTIYDAQITKIKGPIWLNNDQTSAGIFADPRSKSAEDNFSPLPPDAQTLESLTGSMHGGVVRFDAKMSSGPAGEFYLQTTLADGNLEQFCQEFAPQLTDVSGHSFAGLRLKGNYHSSESYRGDGTIQLRDAKIYELPVVLSLLKILKIRQVTRTAFDSSNVEFTVKGENVNFHRIEMLGDAISLLGNGKLNMDREIDLNFYSIVGRNRINIPLLSDLYRASAQSILWINVDGTLDNPRTHRNVLPQINDSLRQLFAGPQSRMAGRSDGTATGTRLR